ncbi:MAG: hypothetical protein SGJ04_01645 [Bacteroidota bacterium]|nr:hypothetical protein [Bacteroidota bacterium]
MMKNLTHPTKILLTLIIILLALVKTASASTVVSARNGPFSTASTWVGEVVPGSDDYIIVNHNVTLSNDITVGANGNGTLTVCSGGNLNGSKKITVAGGNTYSLTNNGIINVNIITINSGEGTFVNNGNTTVTGALTLNNGNDLVNNGTMYVGGYLYSYGAYILNRPGALLTINVKLYCVNPNASLVENYGTININRVNDWAIYIENGVLMNFNGGRINAPTGKIMLEDNAANKLYNYNYINLQQVIIWDNATFVNSDTLIVEDYFENSGYFTTNLGSYTKVVGDFINTNKTSSLVTMNGFMDVLNNLTNDRLITSTDCGGIKIHCNSYNSYSGTISGCVDICDLTRANNNLFVDNNNGTIGASVTKCSYTTPGSSCKPNQMTGPVYPCRNTAGNVYSITAISGSTYTWTVPSGWNITAGATTNSITVTTNTTAGNVTVRVSKTGCVNRLAYPVFPTSGTGAPAQPSTIFSTDGLICANSSCGTFTIPTVSGATSYTWTVPSGWAINFGQGTTSISVTTGSNGGTVSVVATNSCGSSSARTKTVTISNAPSSVMISGPVNACKTGNTAWSYTATQTGSADSYNWTMPNGWIVTNNGGKGTINSNTCVGCGSTISGTTGANNGTVAVAAVSPCGISSAHMSVFAVSSVPTKPTAISGSLGPCPGSSVIYTASGSSNANSYIFTVTGSGWVVTNVTTNSVTVTAGSGAGSICALAANNCGHSASLCITPTATAPPAAPTSITYTSPLCPNTSTTYTSNTVSNATSYDWTFPNGWSVISGAGTRIITLQNNGTTGNVCVRAVNAGGCASGYFCVTIGTANFRANANAGVDQNINTNSTTLNAIPAIGGTGTWTRISGTGNIVFANPNSPNTTVTGINVGNTVLRWTIVYPNSCTVFDHMTIINTNPIPVKLTKFTATGVNNTVKLDWTTVSEVNNEKFEVERSKNGFNFAKIAEVAGNGNYQGELNYSHIDEKPLVGLSFYRLRQVDFNGDFEYTPMVSIKMNQAENSTLLAGAKVYPNPGTQDNLILLLTEMNEEYIDIVITNMSGQTVGSYSAHVSGTQFSIPVRSILSTPVISGIYTITIKGINTLINQRIQLLP